MRRLSAALGLAALWTVTMSAAPPSPAPCGAAPCIQVGTFNIQWLGTTDPRRHEPRSRDEVRRTADLIARRLDLEVVVLQEINPESQEYRWLEEALRERGYRLRPGSGGEQRVVIGWDDDEVDLLGDEGGAGIRELPLRSDFELPGDCRSGNARLPLTGRFRAGSFDFLLVGVHLKSQLGGECADRVRREQAMELDSAVAQLAAAAGEPDVIIAGDFNATLDDPSIAPILTRPGFRALTRPERQAPGSGPYSYLKVPYQSTIDHLVVDLRQTREWLPRSTTVLRLSGGEREWYLRSISDHAPVWASFLTATDDD